jgi:hypothetical protein
MRRVLFLTIAILAGCESGPIGGGPYGAYRGGGYGGLALGGYGSGGGYPWRDYHDRGYTNHFYRQNRQYHGEEQQQEFQRRQLRQQQFQQLSQQRQLQQRQFQQLSQQRQLQQRQFRQQHAAPPTLPATRPPTPQEGQRLLDQLGIRPR